MSQFHGSTVYRRSELRFFYSQLKLLHTDIIEENIKKLFKKINCRSNIFISYKYIYIINHNLYIIFVFLPVVLKIYFYIKFSKYFECEETLN